MFLALTEAEESKQSKSPKSFRDLPFFGARIVQTLLGTLEKVEIIVIFSAFKQVCNIGHKHIEGPSVI